MSACTPFELPRNEHGQPWPIFRELGALPIWCAWSWGDERPEGGRQKPPVCVRHDGVPNDKARWGRWQRPENLTTLAEAMAFAKLHNLPGIGIVVRPEHGLVVGDFDGVVRKGGTEQWARDILAPGGAVAVYTEKSPSGNGLRFIARARGSVPEKTNGVELFDGTALKFTTITGHHTANSPRELLGGQAIVDAALVRAGKAPIGEATPAATEEGHQGGGVGDAAAAPTNGDDVPEAETIRAALATVPCVDVADSDWIKVGHALHDHSGGSDEGRDLWDEWSMEDSGRYVPGETEKRWAGFGKRKPGAKRVTIGSLFALAKAKGWTMPPRAVAAFPAVDGEGDDMEPAPGSDAVYGRFLCAVALGDDTIAAAAELRTAVTRNGLSTEAKAALDALLCDIQGGICEEIPETIGHLLKRISPARTISGRTTVVVNVVQIDASAKHIAKTLISRKVDIFVRGRQLVEVVEEPVLSRKAGGVQFMASLQPVTRTGLSLTVSRHVRLVAGAEGKEREIAPPLNVTNALFDNTHYFDLCPIVQVSEGPMLLSDGSVISDKGYDAGAKVYITQEMDLPPIADRPSRSDALAALAVLDSLLGGFEFASVAGRSAALAAMLTTPARNLFDVVPAVLCSAPTPGSGKSYLFRLVSQIAMGRTGALLAAGRDEAETEKRLDSLLLHGASVACLDNMTSEIGGQKLCQIIEQPQVEIRALGSTNRIVFDNRMSIFCTANNPTFSDDMVRRFLVVRLEPKTERPENRVFDFDPLNMVEQDRPRYLAAVFTVLKAWMAARDDGARVNVTPLASFGEWSGIVRAALVWLDRADPVETQRQGAEITDSRAVMAAIFPAWRAAFGEQAVTVAEAAKAIEDATGIDSQGEALGALDDALRLHMPEPRRGAGTPLAKRLGVFLRPFKGRVCDGLRLDGRETRTGVQAWSVVSA